MNTKQHPLLEAEMSNLVDTRRENGRNAIERAGGVGKVAKRMGYSNASFLVQQFGPNPSRNPTEGTMRKMEEALGLDREALDREIGAPEKKPAIDADLIVNVIRIVGAAMGEEKVPSLPPAKHAELIVLALTDAIEHGGTPREDHARSLVRLLR